MDPAIAERYKDAILRQFMQRYEIGENDVGPLEGFENFIYEFRASTEDELILRIGHSSRRSWEMIAGEVDWINYLDRGGSSVARAVLSKGGNLVEAVDDGHDGEFLGTAFVKAPGGRLPRAEWSPEFVRHYGEVIGRMHKLSKDYALPDQSWRRPAWDSDAELDLDSRMPVTEKEARVRYGDLMCHLQSLPQDRDSYGLIHQDAHGGNFFVHEGRITLFDFDDCVYGWFIYDIAMGLFYALMFEEDPAAYTASFMPGFLRGYGQENRIDPVWLQELPHFMKLREIELYAEVHFGFDLEKDNGAWVRNYMDGRMERIEEGAPSVEFDWESLAACL